MTAPTIQPSQDNQQAQQTEPVASTSEDWDLPPACPLRNNGDEVCEVCQ